MASEREQARRWFCFDTRDLLIFTAVAAVGIAATKFAISQSWHPVPIPVQIAFCLPVSGAILGLLVRQGWGGVIGVLAGGALMLALMAAYIVYRLYL